MTSCTAAPLPVLYLAPPEPGVPADLLLHEVAACVAAVGHRLHVVPRSPAAIAGTVSDAIAAFSAGHGREPVMVVRGGPDAGPAAPWRAGAVPVATVALDGSVPDGSSLSALTLPTGSRSLCRLLARSADPEGGLPGRAVVLSHGGRGHGGDDAWPGLSWGLTLLLAGPGRGVLLDLQGAGGGLHPRLRAATDPLRPVSEAFAHATAPAPAPAPGPALAARLPAVGAVRWWSMAGPPSELLPGVDAALDTFPWTVLDVGRDVQLARQLAAEGMPVLTVTAKDGACCLEPVSAPVSPSVSRAVDRLSTAPALWTGTTPASWGRAVRHRASIDLAARLETVLSRDPRRDRR